MQPFESRVLQSRREFQPTFLIEARGAFAGADLQLPIEPRVDAVEAARALPSQSAQSMLQRRSP